MYNLLWCKNFTFHTVTLLIGFAEPTLKVKAFPLNECICNKCLWFKSSKNYQLENLFFFFTLLNSHVAPALISIVTKSYMIIIWFSGAQPSSRADGLFLFFHKCQMIMMFTFAFLKGAVSTDQSGVMKRNKTVSVLNGMGTCLNQHCGSKDRRSSNKTCLTKSLLCDRCYL